VVRRRLGGFHVGFGCIARAATREDNGFTGRRSRNARMYARSANSDERRTCPRTTRHRPVWKRVARAIATSLALRNRHRSALASLDTDTIYGMIM